VITMRVCVCLVQNSGYANLKEKNKSPETTTNFTEDEPKSKGRDAARQFRERQRTHVDELEKRILLLEQEQETYKSKLEVVEAENRAIREQQNYLRKILEQALMDAYPPVLPKNVSIETHRKSEKVYA